MRKQIQGFLSMLHMRHIKDSYASPFMLVTMMLCFQDLSPDELWIACESGKSNRHTPVHQIAMQLRPPMSRVLWPAVKPPQHFKEKAEQHGLFGRTFQNLLLSTFPNTIDDDVMSYVEAFIVRLYHSSLDITSVNAAGMELFYYKGRHFENLPSTKDTLLQHIASMQMLQSWYGL